MCSPEWRTMLHLTASAILALCCQKKSIFDTLHTAHELRDKHLPRGLMRNEGLATPMQNLWWYFTGKALCIFPRVQNLSGKIIWRLINRGSGSFGINTCKYTGLTCIWHQSQRWDFENIVIWKILVSVQKKKKKTLDDFHVSDKVKTVLLSWGFEEFTDELGQKKKKRNEISKQQN